MASTPTATSTLSLHDALPIYDNTITSIRRLQQEIAETKHRGYSLENEEDVIGTRCIGAPVFDERGEVVAAVSVAGTTEQIDRKSTRLNSSHRCISYAVFCLKK